MGMPKVSVVTPVYNVREEWLRQSLDSILAQTMSDFELIIVDDGSSPETHAICEAYQSLDSRIRLFAFEQNRGIAAAMNYGIAQAQSPYIAVHDGDDISHPQRLAQQYANMISDPGLALIGSDMELLFEPDVPEEARNSFATFLEWYNNVTANDLPRELLRGSCIANGSAMYRKDAAVEAGLYNPAYRQLMDWEFFTRLSKTGGIGKLNEPLFVYRRHGSSYCYGQDTSDLMSDIQLPLLNERLKAGTKVALWGTGAGGLSFLRKYNELSEKRFSIRKVIDGSGAKAGQHVNGYLIETANDLRTGEVDLVLITVSVAAYIVQIKESLQKLGFKESQIMEVYAPV
jgi:glycosyltransferase involved in cell wall biosynthesis